MDYLKTGLLIIIPYIAYYFLMKWLEEEKEVEMSKFLKMIIFISIDLLILLLFK